MITLPGSNIRLLAPQNALSYYDSQSMALPAPLTPLEIWNLTQARPQPLMRAAFKIRDAISGLFGVRKIGGFSGKPHLGVKPGDYMDFFLVEHIDDTCLAMTERDRHLDVMTCLSVQNKTLTITSSVQVHNTFGRAYMLPVGIAHRYIVRSMLSRLKNQLQTQ
ncbi:MAG: DUF2867 domain-containing protein [Sulfitobacter sp.]